MKKVEESKNERKEELVEVFALWNKVSKSGLKYLTGKVSNSDIETIDVIAYYNTTKKNPKEPDIRIYSVDKDGKQDKEIASLWDKITKNDKRILSGMTIDNERLVGFYNSEEINNRPYIKVYYENE